jgi:cbb3-type cytochrome oxidase cytochrome c subunit
MNGYAVTIRAYGSEGTIADVNAIINYLQPLGLTVNNIQIIPCNEY